VRAAPPYASTFAGQATLSLLIELVARQFGVVERIAIDVPDVDVQPAAFPRTKAAAGLGLRAALLDVGRSAAGPEISVESAAQAEAAAVVDVGQRPEGARARVIALSAVGANTAAWCTSNSAVPDRSSSRVPFGPHLAACLAADRVFRALRGVDATGDFSIDLATFRPPADESTPDLAVALPPAYLVGLGAVGAAALYSLTAARTIECQIVGIDDDRVADTNRNRLLSAAYDDIGKFKADLAEALSQDSTVRFWKNSLRWERYPTEPKRRAPAELLALEPFKYEWVLSAVDKNTSRRDIAMVMPRHVLAASTDGLVAQSAYYAMTGQCECLACNHPVPSFNLDALAQELGAMSPKDLGVWFDQHETSLAERAAITDYLRDPDCGKAGEAALRRLGIAGDIEWAVGHVSVAAGVMLAHRFAAYSANHTLSSSMPAEQRLFFLRSGSADLSPAIRKSACDVCGDPDRQRSYAGRWESAGR